MKHFRLVAIIWGFTVVLVLPILLFISRWKYIDLLTFQEYIIYVLLFIVMTYILKERKHAGEENNEKEE